jgi:HSP20 family protein
VGKPLSEDKDKEKAPDYKDILGVKIFGIDFGSVLKNLLGVDDLSILKDPAQADAVKRRIEEQKASLRDVQERLRGKFGDAVRFDYDIRVSGLSGGKDEVHIGGGSFFDKLDQLARERSRGKPAPYRKQEGVVEPYTEVIEGESNVEVIAEMPGVEEKDIDLKVQEDRIAISTPGPKRIYRAEVVLPARVLGEPLEKSYHNGVFKLRLKKSQEPKTR